MFKDKTQNSESEAQKCKDEGLINKNTTEDGNKVSYSTPLFQQEQQQKREEQPVRIGHREPDATFASTFGQLSITPKKRTRENGKEPKTTKPKVSKDAASQLEPTV